jgi:hypothetical protein
MTPLPLSSSGAITTLLLLEQYSSSVNAAIVSSLINPWIMHCQIKQLYAENGQLYQQKKWSVFSKQLIERQFLCYFCMLKALFKKSCNKIEGIVGPEIFWSEDYLDEILNRQLPDSDHNHQ